MCYIHDATRKIKKPLKKLSTSPYLSITLNIKVPNKGKKSTFKQYIRVTYKKPWNYLWLRKNPFFKILKNVAVMTEKPCKNAFFQQFSIFSQFLALKWTFLNILQNGFRLTISYSRRFFWYATWLYLGKLHFLPLNVTSKVNVLVRKIFQKDANEFRRFIS